MIITLILNVFYVFIGFIISILPDAQILPEAFATAFQWLFGLLWNFDSVVSVDTVITILGLSLAFQASILLFNLIVWIIHLIRGK